ncbi:nickel insertion protein [Streptomyces xantholiticus]
MIASGRVAWIDATSGVAGDMLLGALFDAGASLEAVQAAVDAVVPASVRLTRTEVTRCGMRAVKAGVEVLDGDQPHRTWRTVRELLRSAEVAQPVRAGALAVFERLAGAEARVHGVPAGEVHFHEVGAWDSIADVVGVCAALHDLGVTRLTASAVAVGSGRARTAHGEIPVPVPAVLELAAGREIFGGGSGERRCRC